MVERDVYRTPGLEPAPAPIPRPSLRRLLSPLAWGVTALVPLLVPLVAFNAVFDPDASNGFRETRPIPAVDRVEDVLALALLGTIAVTVGVLVRRVVPIWQGLGRRTRALYVAALVAAQSAAILGAEAIAFVSRGGLHLFEPTLSSSSPLPDGRSAYVYADGLLGASYRVYVAEPGSVVMRKELVVTRHMLETEPPRVRANADGSLELLDAAGRRLESQSPLSFLFHGGC